MAQYKVRDGFYVWFDENRNYGPGDVVELTPEEAELHVLRIEPVEAPKRQRKAAADDAAE